MMIGTGKLLAMLVLCLVCVAPAGAAEQSVPVGQDRSFTLPQHGTLVLKTPLSWQQSVRQPATDLPPTIKLTPESGGEFKVLVTPLWNPQQDPTYNAPDKIKALLERDLASMLPGAVEKQVEIRPIDGAAGSGYYFRATDRAPKAGDYPHALRAGVGVGDLLLSVTVLAKTPDSPAFAATLRMLEEARQVY